MEGYSAAAIQAISADELAARVGSLDANCRQKLQAALAGSNSAAGSVGRAAMRVMIEGGGDNGKPWVKHAKMEDIDWMFDPILPICNIPLVRETSAEPTAVELAADQKIYLLTNVFATVYCPGWLLQWIIGTASLVIRHYRTCAFLHLHALKGGPMCGCEILFLVELLKELGFTCDVCGKETNPTALPGVLTWGWHIDRPDAEPYKIELIQYSDAHKVKKNGLAATCTPMKKFSKAPNLRRTAVLSAPLSVFGDAPCSKCNEAPRCDEVLNLNLIAAIDEVEKFTAAHGFYEDHPGEWNKLFKRLSQE